MTEYYTNLGYMLAGGLVLLSAYITIKKMGRENDERLVSITEKFNKSINDLNQTVSNLNVTLEFYKEQLTRQGERMTSHGKEIDELRCEQGILNTRLSVLENNVSKSKRTKK